ncbi:MAG: sigma-70 family RNA polymerase sigma factor, partial [Opitutaceae bacterium]
MTDLELLHDYADRGSQAAFATLVTRHLDLVYSAARRQVRSPQLADEIAQSVFIDLARHPRLKSGAPLVAWLFLVTRRTAIDALRRESTRRAHEATATEIAPCGEPVESGMKTDPSPWPQIEPLLDEAIATLNDADRTAVLLRFF